MTVIISFEEPDISEGPIHSITKDGVTIRFLRPVSVFRPSVSTHSGPHALYNASQDITDETGFQKPIIFEFSQLQRRVRVLAGLNERDLSLGGAAITARLVAYDFEGIEVDSVSGTISTTGDPSPIETPLEVRASSDRIHRVELAYNGNVREVIDDLEFESDATTTIPPDTTAPAVTISHPQHAEEYNSRTLIVTGTIVEVNGVTLVINGTTVPVQRTDANSYFFSAEITLPGAMSNVEAVATDEAGNVGRDSRTVDIRVPTQFSVSDVRFTQSGLIDPAAAPLPTRRVARKTSLFRLTLGILTDDGRPTSVDKAEIVVEGGPVVQSFPGQPRPTTGDRFTRYGYHRIRDGQQAYFFIDGRILEPGHLYRFILKLYLGSELAYQRILEASWSFENIGGITMLLVPQHRRLEDNYSRALIRVLEESARMFPVPDGIASIDGSRIGGIRYAVSFPVSYRDHMDPADPPAPGTTPIAYEQGFLLHDHNIRMQTGPDGLNGTSDDGPTSVPGPGEFIGALNSTFPEDENRNGMFETEEAARISAPPGGTAPIAVRGNDWSNFVRETANSKRLAWNRDSPSRSIRRAIAIVTSSVNRWPNRITMWADRNAQNRTGWEGNAAAGEPSFWASLDIGETAFIPHEVGHNLGFSHTDATTPPSPCEFPGEAINLLTRRFVSPTEAPALMCSGIGGSDLFLSNAEYNALFDRLLSMGGQN